MTDFSSIDRLMDLGLSMALARQMVETMNSVNTTVHYPGACTSTPQIGEKGEEARCWYAVIDSKQAGPLSEAEISSLIAKNLLDSHTLLWRPPMPGWLPATDIPEIYRLLLLA